MFTMEEIETEIRTILKGAGYDAVGFSNEAPFYEKGKPASDGELDSLDFVEVIMSIEERFSIEIPDGPAEKLVTVRAAADFVADALERRRRHA